MKVAVTATGPSLDDALDPRFGRCPCLVLVETDDMAFEPVENGDSPAAHGIRARWERVSDEIA